MVKKTSAKVARFVIPSIFVLVILAVLVWAAVVTNLDAAEVRTEAPVTGANYSGWTGGSVLFNVSFNNNSYNVTGVAAVTNATIYYNMSAVVWGIVGNMSRCVRTSAEYNSSCYGNLNASRWSNGTIVKDGIYTVNISLWNGSTSMAHTGAGTNNMTTVLIDNTAPNQTTVVSVFNASNHSTTSEQGNLTLNVSVFDALAGIQRVEFIIINSTGQVNGTYLADNIGSTYWSTSVNTSHYRDDMYNITVLVNDTAGNYASGSNSTTNPPVRTVYFDNGLPTITFSCSPTTSNTGDTVTCSCSASSTSGINETSFTVNPSTSNTGTHTQTCTATNRAGVSSSKTTTYTVNLAGNGPSGNSGGTTTTTTTTTTTWTTTIPGADKELSEKGPITKSLGSKERVSLKVGGESHHVGITSLTSDSATIEVSSTPQTATLKVGESKKFDVNADGFYDLSVVLNSIKDNKADITITPIKEELSAADKAAAADDGETGSVAEEESSGIGKTGWIISIIVIIVILALVAWFVMRKK